MFLLCGTQGKKASRYGSSVTKISDDFRLQPRIVATVTATWTRINTNKRREH